MKERDAPVFVRSMRSYEGGGADHGAPIAAAKVEKLRLAAAGPQQILKLRLFGASASLQLGWIAPLHGYGAAA
ncbi:hypothetical protein GAY28_37105 [Azospirillum brasilense]|uniref:hypothetical protein n=1 Tax=Azospirillum argentinense TaxID=2970906 RepID=UPI00157B6961|nr:hypothetical protein [Azospirillum argentinense]MBK3800571.1 hypothetical protein [Azospirillum argentinense]NUB17398.1 hypothetical protein [Azospirillum brasilense]